MFLPAEIAEWATALDESPRNDMNARKGVRTVKDYRLYYLDGFSGHIDGVEEFAAASDDHALAAALERSDGRAMELWHRHHKLRHWDEAVSSLD
jgi:hypothetical protein